MFIWHRIFCLLFAICFGSVVLAQRQEEDNILSINNNNNNKRGCPNYQYKCPDCPSGTKCVYPNSGGCEGAGIPVCQSQSCGSAVCLIKAFPCSEECSFSCEYTGPKCCPFIGQPACYACDTFAPCQESSCPEDCPNDCFYPDADWCCPKSGTPICKNNDNNVELLPSTIAALRKTATTIEYHQQPLAPAINRVYKRDTSNMPSTKWIQSGWFYQPAQSKLDVISRSTSISTSWFHQSNSPSESLGWFKQPINQQQEQQATSSNWFKQPINQKEQPNPSNWFKQSVNQQRQQVTASNWFKQPINQQQQATSSNWFEQAINQQVQPTPSNWFKQPVNIQQQQQDTSSNWFKQPINQQEQPTPSNWFKQPVNIQQQEQQATSSNWFKQPINQQEVTSSNWFTQPVNQQQQPSYVTPTIPLESSRAFDNSEDTQQEERGDKLEWFYQPSKILESGQPWFYQPTPDKSSNNNRVIMENAAPSGTAIEEKCNFDCPDIPVPTWGTCTVYQDLDECCPRIECVGVPISFDPEQPSTSTVSSVPTPLPSNTGRDGKQVDEKAALCPDYIIPCPDICPDECSYPHNVACPYQYQPACPSFEHIVLTTPIDIGIFSEGKDAKTTSY